MNSKYVNWSVVNRLPPEMKCIFVEEYIAQAAREIDAKFAKLIETRYAKNL